MYVLYLTVSHVPVLMFANHVSLDISLVQELVLRAVPHALVMDGLYLKTQESAQLFVEIVI